VRALQPEWLNRLVGHRDVFGRVLDSGRSKQLKMIINQLFAVAAPNVPYAAAATEDLPTIRVSVCYRFPSYIGRSLATFLILFF
jgi:hypothetical protein